MDCFLIADLFCSLSSTAVGLIGDVTSFALPLAQAATDDAERGISWKQYLALGIAIAVLVVPFLLGGFFAKSLKMPNYGTRFGFVLLAVIASIVVLINKRPGLGVDLRGGTILVYEIDPEKNTADGDGVKIKSEDLIEPLTRLSLIHISEPTRPY